VTTSKLPCPRTLAPDEAQDIARAVNELVGYYTPRTISWHDPADLTQKAWVVALENLPRWDPARGPRVPYLATCLRRQMGNQLVRDHAPVSASKHHLYDLYHLRGADLNVPGVNGDRRGGGTRRCSGDPQGHRASVEGSVDGPDWADAVLADREWLSRVRARLATVAGEDGAEGLADLLREDPREPAPGKANAGQPPTRLTRSRAVALCRIAQDSELRALAEADTAPAPEPPKPVWLLACRERGHVNEDGG
jgi:hypothetical protein